MSESDKKPLLMLCYEYPPLGGGGARVVANLCEDLDSLGQPVELITMGFGKLSSDEQRGLLRVFRVPGGRSRVELCYAHEMLPYLFTCLNKLWWRLRVRKYLINHTHFVFPDGVVAWLTRLFFGLPYIITAHGSDVPGYNPDRFTLMHTLLAPFWKRITTDAEVIICPSWHLQGLILAQNPKARTMVIPNGIDITRYRPDQPKDGSILVVTRMFERKGVQYLIRALADMRDYPEVNIVGDGPYLPELRKLAEELGCRVNFLGFIDNKTERFINLLESARYFIFTSAAENFPIVLLEAMTAALCIITSNDNGCIEVVDDCAVTIPPKQEQELKLALQRVLADPELAASYGKRARERVEAHFCSEAVTRKHLELYKSLSGGG
jgi:glycosyltransferase involved in cell wall biosynthesis